MNLLNSEIMLMLSDNDHEEKIDYVLQGRDIKEYNMMSVMLSNLLSINFAGYQYSKSDIAAYETKCRTFLVNNGITVVSIQLEPIGLTHGFMIEIDSTLDQLKVIRNLKGGAIRSDK